MPWHRDIKERCSKGLSILGGYRGLYQLGPEGELVVWELKEDHDNKEEWIKLMTITCKCLRIIRRGFKIKPLQPICLLQNGKLLLCKREYILKKYEGEPIQKNTSFSKRKRRLYCAVAHFYPVVNFVVYDPKRSSILEAFPIQGISGNYYNFVTYKESCFA